MTVTVGAIRFDHVDYDRDADVLYLSVGPPAVPADSYGTPEGHNVRYGADGSVVGLTLVNARWLLERDGEIGVTIPGRVSADAVADALASPGP